MFSINIKLKYKYMVILSTYLQSALKDNKIFRWPDKLMPLKIYVAPFRWYQKSKQQESLQYHFYVMEALKIWSEATNNKFTYTLTNDYNSSNINVTWRRVNRQSLGLCHMSGTEDYMMYSAEVEIGISDGLIHADYQNTNEVKHTIIHEMGHAIGMPHSPNQNDIMYVPHQYGVVDVSSTDKNTAKWLYMLDPGFQASLYMEDWGLDPNSSIDQLIWVYENQDKYEQLTDEMQQKKPKPDQPKQLLTINEQQDFLAYKNLYNMSLQKINVNLNPKQKINGPFKTLNTENNLFKDKGPFKQ